MDAYIYQADIYCEDCGRAIIRRLHGGKPARDNGGRFAPIDYEGTSGDSNDYPAGPYTEGGGESDVPQHCGSHGGCENAIELNSGHKVGCFLENPLTSDGTRYVEACIREHHESGRGEAEVLRLWAEYYHVEFEPVTADSE